MQTTRTLIAIMFAVAILPACVHAQEVVITGLTMDDPDNPTNLTFHPLPFGTVSWSNATLQTYCSLDFTRELGDDWLPLWQNRLVTNALMSGPLTDINTNGMVWATMDWFMWLGYFRPSAFPSNSCFFRLRSSADRASACYTNVAIFINSSSSAVSNLVADFGIDWSHQNHSVPWLPPGETNRWEFGACAPIPTYDGSVQDPSAWVTGRYDIAGERVGFSFGICGYLIPDVTLTILDDTYVIE